MKKMRRRQFLAYLTALGGAGALLVLLRPYGRGRRAAFELETLLGNDEGTSEIGRAYLSLAPAEAHAQLLRDRIFSDIRWHLLRSTDVRDVLASRVHEDFREGRVVQLQGWLVSLTEARLCALVALGNGESARATKAP